MDATEMIVSFLVGTGSGIASGLIVNRLSPPIAAITGQPASEPAELPRPSSAPAKRHEEHDSTDSDDWNRIIVALVSGVVAVGLYLAFYDWITLTALFLSSLVLAFALTVLAYRNKHGGRNIPRTRLVHWYCVMAGLGMLGMVLARFPIFSDRPSISALRRLWQEEGVAGIGMNNLFSLLYEMVGILALLAVLALASAEILRRLAIINRYVEARPLGLWTAIAARSAPPRWTIALLAVAVVVGLAMTSGLAWKLIEQRSDDPVKELTHVGSR